MVLDVILCSNKTYHIVYNWILKLISYIISTIGYLLFYIISNENVDIKLNVKILPNITYLGVICLHQPWNTFCILVYFWNDKYISEINRTYFFFNCHTVKVQNKNRRNRSKVNIPREPRGIDVSSLRCTTSTLCEVWSLGSQHLRTSCQGVLCI